MKLALDHIVLAARSLDDGVAWCERTLGITPGPGGTHRLMGTHNRLFRIAGPAFPRAYFEIIAIDPQAAPPGRVRWFGLDETALQRALEAGPRLLHWVARCDAIDAAVAEAAQAGVDAGRVLSAERETAHGMLRWRIAVRDDGRLLHGGAWPTLLEWGEVHPADTMPDSGVTLQSVRIAGLPAALARMLPDPMVAPAPTEAGPDTRAAAARSQAPQPAATLEVMLRTPRGLVTLSTTAPET